MNLSRDSWEKNGSAMASRFTVHNLLDRLEDGDFDSGEVEASLQGLFGSEEDLLDL